MTASQPHLSLIIPVFRGASYLADSVSEIVSTLEKLDRPFEVLVVTDGCAESAAVAAALSDPRVISLGYEFNHGKGYAITYGIAHARGRLIGWLDGDLDVAPSVIVDAVRAFDAEEIDAVVGSKRHPDSAVHYPLQRRILSWGFQKLVRLLFRFDVRDTQVGAKLFRREMLGTVAPLLLIKRYAFDLEVLAVGAEFGFDRVREVPIQLAYRFSGTGINSSAVRLMFRDTLAIAYRIHLRHWYVRQYAALQRHRAEAVARSGDDAGMHLPAPPLATMSGIRATLR